MRLSLFLCIYNMNFWFNIRYFAKLLWDSGQSGDNLKPNVFHLV